MIAISFRFPGGRYHGTPWDSHVNEGRIEWPPSPWRIARALVAAWHKLAAPPDEAISRRLVLALGATAPRYRLPPASASHTRHYMPIAKTTTKVLDAFVSVSARDHQDGGPDGALVVGWELDFSDAERVALAALLEGVAYLGRAESWVEATITDQIVEWNVVPDGPGTGNEVFLWTVSPEAEWLDWRADFLAGVTTKKKPNLPASSWEVLTQETSHLQKAGWSMPPGLKAVRYVVPHDAIRVSPRPRAAPAPSADLAWVRLGGAVLPLVADTTWIAERMRVAAMAWSKDQRGLPSPVFSGHVLDGSPAAGHQHAWFIPSDEDGDGLLDHIAVWAPAGLRAREQDALANIRELWGNEGHPLDTTLLALTMAARHPAWRHTATIWRSETPFICSRHPKRRGDGWKDSVEQQVTRAWHQYWEHRRTWPTPPDDAFEPAPGVGVELMRREGPAARSWSAFRIDRPHRVAFGALEQRFDLKLTFEREIRGPIGLGAGAHYGLGRFAPVLP